MNNKILKLGLAFFIIIIFFKNIIFGLSFFTAPTYKTGDAPYYIASNDFNGDNKLDLAIVNSGSDNVSILLNNGDGSFKPQVTYKVGDDPRCIVSGDFNGDNKLDLAIANYASNIISILSGNGDGTFQQQVTYNAGNNPRSLISLDLNGDSKLDLAAVNYTSNDISIFISNGDGSFQPQVTYKAGDTPSSITSGDFNGDNKIDLAVTNSGSDNVSILLGIGDGTFNTQVAYKVGDNPRSITCADFDGDSKLDLAIANTSSNNISILLGNGDGTFQTQTTFAMQGSPLFIIAKDLNNDNKSDLVVTNSDLDTISVLLNNGDGTFADIAYIVGDEPRSVIFGDFNGDNKPDLAVANTKSDNVSIFIGFGNGNFNASSIYNTGNSPQFAFSGDFNGDNKLDLAIANSASNNISIFIGNGDGTFELPKTYGGIGLTPYFITMGDFDGDNKPDLAVANKGSNDISIYPGNGDETFGIESTFDVGNSPVSLVTGDFNRDDKLDLAVVNSGSNTVSILIGNGDGTFQTQVTYSVGYSPSCIITADFNRDYKLDLAVTNSGSGSVSILSGNGDGTFQKQVSYSTGSSPSSIISGDFNKDNKPDLAVTNSSADTISILIGKRDGSFEKQVTYKTGDAPSSIISGDFNKDNNPDLAVTNSGSDNISIFIGNGNGIFASQINFNTGDKPLSICGGDFNGDDKSDLIITNFGSNNFWSFFNTTPQETHFIKINNETLYAEIDTTRACITSLIYKKGSNTQLIAPQWGAYLIDFGSDPWIGNKLKKDWVVESLDSTQSNQIKISFKHALGFANEMLLSWQDDHIDVQCDINAPQAIETFNVLKPGGTWEADQDKWAFPALDTTQTGNFSYPRIHTGIYPQDHSWGTPKEGWLALWDNNIDEVYGFTFSGGFKAKICNGVGAYQHFLFPAGTSRIAFHVVKTKPAVAYEAIRDKSTGPYLAFTTNVNSIFASPGNELTYTLVYSNTGRTDATNTIIESILPSELEIVDGSISNGGSYTSETREITWNIGTLVSGGAETVTFKAKVANTVSTGAKIITTSKIWCKEETVATSAQAITTVGAPIITSITPDKGGNAGSVTITIKGQNLDPNAVVKLVKAGEQDVVASYVAGLNSGTGITATFDFIGKTSGVYDLMVNNPAGGNITLSNGFTIEQGGEAKLWVEIVGKDTIRPGRETVYMYRYGNAGNVDIAMAFLEIELPSGFVCKEIKDNGHILWNQNTDSDSPLVFVTGPLSLGEVHSLSVVLIATTLSSRPQSVNPIIVPILYYFGKQLAWSAIERFAKSFFKHKWDEHGPPGIDNIYEVDWINAFKLAWKDFTSNEGLANWGIKFWFSNIKTLMIKNLEKLGKNGAAYYLNNLYITIVDLPNWAKVLRENFNKDPNFNKATPSAKMVTRVRPIDPNDKAGPTGFDSEDTPQDQRKHFIPPDVPVPYMVFFENMESASAAAQEVLITDQLDSNLDWQTFSAGDMQIGNNTVSIPEGMQNFNTTVILNFETTSAQVRINCNFDTSTGIAKWLLQGRNPYDTSELADFLPPNKEAIAPQGEGWISYSVKQKPNLPTGTVIKNKARIDFEVDIPPEPMDTPEYINTIDSGLPTSKVNALSASQNFDSFDVTWSGSDDTGGSGIRDYTIYVSDNNGEYESWLTNTKETSGIFKGKANHTYKFYSIAADNVGNIESKLSEPDAETSIKEASVNTQENKKKTKKFCFITAITKEKHSGILTKFRDNYLFTNYLGRTFTNLYYKISPLIIKSY